MKLELGIERGPIALEDWCANQLCRLRTIGDELFQTQNVGPSKEYCVQCPECNALHPLLPGTSTHGAKEAVLQERVRSPVKWKIRNQLG